MGRGKKRKAFLSMGRRVPNCLVRVALGIRGVQGEVRHATGENSPRRPVLPDHGGRGKTIACFVRLAFER